MGDGREEGRVDKIRKMGVSNTGMVSKIGVRNPLPTILLHIQVKPSS